MLCSPHGDSDNYCVLRVFSARPCAKLLPSISFISTTNEIHVLNLGEALRNLVCLIHWPKFTQLVSYEASVQIWGRPSLTGI